MNRPGNKFTAKAGIEPRSTTLVTDAVPLGQQGGERVRRSPALICTIILRPSAEVIALDVGDVWIASSELNIGTLVSTLPDEWRCRAVLGLGGLMSVYYNWVR